MKTGKKILAFLLAAMMMLTLLPAGALAVEADPTQNITVYKNADNSVVGNYSTIKAAGDAVPTDGVYTIKLNQNIAKVGTDNPTADEKLIFTPNQKIVLDLNDKTMYGLIICGETGAELTIQDTSEGKNGRVTGIGENETLIVRRGGKASLESGTIEGVSSVNAIAAVAVCRIKNSNTAEQGSYQNFTPGEFTMNGGKVLQSATTEKAASAILNVGGKLIINDGEIEAKHNAAVAGNGKNLAWYMDTETTINGGKFIGYDSGIYHPQRGRLTIHGGEIICTDGSGVVMRGGTVVVMDGGKIKNKVGGTHVVGDAKNEVPCSSIVLDAKANYYDFANMDANIIGGCFVDNTLSPDIIGASATTGKQLELVPLAESDPEYADGYRYTLGETEAIADVRPSVGGTAVESTTGVAQAAIDAAGTVEVEPTQEMSKIAEDQAKTITESQKTSYLAKSEAQAINAGSLHVQTYLDIKVQSYDDTAHNDLVLDIQPKTRVVASSTGDPKKIVLTAGGEEAVNSVVITETIKNAQVEGDTPVTITLPADFYTSTDKSNNTKVYVYHNGVECADATVGSANGDGQYPLTFTTDGFSPFKITKEGPAASITKGGTTTSYATFAAAVAAAADGDTIKVLKTPDADNKITINGKNVTLVPDTSNGVTIDPQYVVTNGTATKDDSTGNVTVTKPVTVVGGGSGSGEEEDPTKEGFADVPDGQWYTDAVNWAVENGITAGITPSLFMPKKACTRGEAVTFLWRAAGKPEPKTTVCPFSDVKETDFCYKAVLWAVENKITAGAAPGEFGKDWICTRGHTVTFMWNWASRKQTSMTNPFTDVPTGKYYEAPVLWALSNNITAGITDTTFAPKMSCNRAHIVTFLYRYMGK